MTLKKSAWGTAKTGETVWRYTLSNKNGMSVELCNIGASILRLLVPAKDGRTVDVALGYDSLEEYEHNGANFGCVVGRYGNRIKGGQFSFYGKTCQLEQNEGNNHLHGASGGYAFRYWDCVNEAEDHVSFRLLSPDGDGGYPGNLTALVTYTLSGGNALTLSYRASTDTAAFCNLTNHNYFNLSGAGNGTVLDHEVMIHADAVTEIDKESIPTGRLLPVKDTALDFHTPKAIGRDIESDWEQMTWPGGYDHNYILKKDGAPAASVYAPETGIVMEVETNCPGMQFYTGNGLGGSGYKDGKAYEKRGGFCMETQFYPDSINRPEFPSCEVTKDAPQKLYTTYRFFTRG